jgi:predicted CXXCH cytochrome family protein
MTPKMLRSRLLSAAILAGGLVLAPRGAEAQESCTTASCHGPLLKHKTIHAATDDCGSCHVTTSSPHPQKGKKTFKLSAAVPGLCVGCHDAPGTKKVVHPPVKEGMCTTCHNPHASDEPKLLAKPMRELCQSCHTELANLKEVHGPFSAGDCTACHAPHESDNKAFLVKEGEELCFGCHSDIQELLKKADVHPALQAGCTSCHNPHGSAHPKLLAEEGVKLCAQCHDAVAEQAVSSRSVHAPVKSEQGCTSCHSPHASDGAKLLPKSEKELCLGCHKNVITASMTTLHGPINQGRCTPCHDPHGSGFAKLLVREFPADAYAPYTEKEYDLCFGCHKRELLQYPDTSFATGFRAGQRNLHYLHVNNKEKGRSCRLCHNVHGSSSPKLIAESVPFGKWTLPLKFVKTETGGSCSPGCHKPLSYDRKNR